MARIEKPLPSSLMNVIMRTLEDDDISLADRFEAVVLICHGFGLWSAKTGPIDPTHYAIPQSQWFDISEGLLDARSRAGGDGVGSVNLALSWMNVGPSAYEPTEEN